MSSLEAMSGYRKNEARNDLSLSQILLRRIQESPQSKILEKAMDKANNILSSKPMFLRKIQDFPTEIREENIRVFMEWLDVLYTVSTYTEWDDYKIYKLQLRLQNAPGKDGMDGFNEGFASFAELMNQLLPKPPPPFAQPFGWAYDQQDSLILCLRPGSARGLPLCMLHDVFRTFQRENSVLFSNSTMTAESMSTEVVAIHLSAIGLCRYMGDSFGSAHHRGVLFDACVADLFEKWEQVPIHGPGYITDYSEVKCLVEQGVKIVLRQDQWEVGHGKADVYMQIAQDYDFLVKALIESTETAAINFLSHGAPCFLICVLGPMLFICGGFYDGCKPIVEPLSKPVFMLRDSTTTRYAEVATLLRALVTGISSLRRLVSEPLGISFEPSTPRIYRTCTLIQPHNEIGTLTFESRMGNADQLLFLATLDSSSYHNIKVFVKLVPNSYSQDVQEHLAAHGLAPKLYGSAKVDGAPTAYIMEYLDPSVWQCLNQFLGSDRVSLGSYIKLQKAIQNIITVLELKKYVHGDLRATNIMIRKDTCDSPDLRVIDFDWAGVANQVCYPANRNPDFKWPGQAGGLIQDGHDRELVLLWLPPLDEREYDNSTDNSSHHSSMSISSVA